MESEKKAVFSFGEHVLDARRRSLHRNGDTVALNAKAFDVLLYLVKNAGRVVSKDELMEEVWPGAFVEEGNLSVQISALRKALEESAAEPKYLATVPGKGYQFIGDVKRHVLNAESAPSVSGEGPANVRTRTSTALVYLAAAVVLLAAAAAYFLIPRPIVKGTEARSVAVLPFIYAPSETEEAIFGEGFADSVIFSLSRVPGLKVMSRQSSFRFGPDATAKDVGAKLGVETILTGRITKDGESLQISAELVSTSDNSVLWGERLSRPISDIEMLQIDISRKIANALGIDLSADSTRSVDVRPTDDHEAFQHYLAGRFYLAQLTDEGFAKARESFQRAIEADANYALAYAGLAEANNLLSGWGAIAPNDGFPLAKAAAVRALQLDEGIAEAHTQMGVVRLFYDLDWEGASRDFERAVELNPSSSAAHHMNSYVMMVRQRFQEAERSATTAAALDPLSVVMIITKGNVYLYRRDIDRAIVEYQKALELEPNSGLAHWAVGNGFIFAGNFEGAEKHLNAAMERSGDSADEPASLAIAYAKHGKREEAMKIAEELRERAATRYVSPALFGAVSAALDEKDEAFRYLEDAVRNRDSLIVFLKIDPMFDSLRDDPRFTELTNRLRLP
ncbi:MAG: winged helix-turn-helix domain-containing protein [Blastocatellia bacterium]|nr:winged helix-turn-helix domain-containing protein [Blastocatellia bacterium]